MALAAATVWEVRTAGSDVAGGGFVTGAAGTDYSQQDSKNTAGSDISTTDAVAVGTTTITSLTANFGTTIVGNIVYFAGGTGSIAAQWRQVTARASTTSITIDASIAASTGMTMNIGGALLSPAIPFVSAVASNVVWIKSGSYSITSASTNVAGGCISCTVNSVRLEGYNATRGDLGTRPTLTASGISTFVLVTFPTSGNAQVRNLILDGASLTSSRGLLLGRGIAFMVAANNFTNNGFSTNGSSHNLIKCTATGCSTQAAFLGATAGSYYYGCEAYTNTIAGFSSTSNQGVYDCCLAYGNSGASTDGISLTGTHTSVKNCVMYNNGRDGIRSTGQSCISMNCIAETNSAGIGINYTGAGSLVTTNGVFGNSTDVVNSGAGSITISTITGASSFFTNAAGGNFALNNTASAGNSLRATALPGTFPTATTISYLDIGAAQHVDPAGIQMARVFSGF